MTSDELLAALRSRKLAALTVFVVVVAASVAAALLRAPTYTAQARLNVGQGTITSQSVPGYAVGIQSLASTYSRAIVAQSVTNSLSRDLGIAPDVVRSRLSASPIPDSSVIVVQATGPSNSAAISLANRGGDALIRYVTQHSSGDQSAKKTLRRYRHAAVALATATDKLARLRKSGASSADLVRAQADVQAARLRSKTLSQSYTVLQQGVSASSLLQRLAPASTATSDAKSWLERVSVLGVLAGAFLAILTAVALERRRVRSAAARRAHAVA